MISVVNSISRRKALKAGLVGTFGAVGVAAVAGCGETVTIEKIVEVPVDRIVTVEKEVPVEVIKEVVVEPAAPARPSTVTLEFWASHGLEAFEEVQQAFERKQSRIKVDLVHTPRMGSAVGTDPKFLAAVLGGIAPSMILHDGSAYATSAALNAFETIDEYVKASNIDMDDYFPFAREKVTWNGRLHGLPLNTDARMMYFNVESLDAAGVEVPTTIPELDEATEKLTSRGADGTIEHMGFFPWDGNWFLLGWGWAWGGKFWDGDTDKISINDQGMVSALEWEVGYAEKYGIENISNFRAGFQSGANNPFFINQIDLWINGDWNIGDLHRFAPDLAWDTAPAPAPDGMDPVTWAGGFALGIPKGTKSPDESFEMLAFYAGPEGQAIFSELTTVLPTLAETAEVIGGGSPEHKKFLDMLPGAFSEPVIPEWALAWDVHLVAEEEALFGQRSAQQALDEANAVVQEAVDVRLSR